VNDPQRMKELKEALSLIRSATKEEASELFKNRIAAFETHRLRLEEPDNRFDTHSRHAYMAVDEMETFVRQMTGYNAGWTIDAFTKHFSEHIGRNAKYNTDIRITNCYFITQMVHRGASETQAMKLLMRLRGDGAMSSGHLRELRDTYSDYKKIDCMMEGDLSMFSNVYSITEFLEFSISNLEGNELASQKAVDAFRSFFQELIDLMKSNHSLVASKDTGYPEIFGCVIDWMNAEYKDPLDYFYTHDSHHTVRLAIRRRALSEYIHTMSYYLEEALKP